MKVIPQILEGVFLIEPKVFSDSRGYFFESFNHKLFEEVIGRPVQFVQDNHSYSKNNILRGMHYQIKQAQGKLIRVIAGTIYDVAVDLRKSSATFGHWVGATLSADNKQQFWIPEGFAHGFIVLSDGAEVLYKTTAYWAPEYECCIHWQDPDLNIAWPNSTMPLVSAKDQQGLTLKEALVFE